MIDLTGKKIGRLKVLELAYSEPKKKGTFWRCLCKCGKKIVVWGGCLRSKTRPTKSCGCLRSETSRNNWKNEEYRKRVTLNVRKSGRSKKVREKIGRASSKLWQDPSYREKTAKAIRKATSKPSYRKNVSRRVIKAWRDPETRASFMKGHRRPDVRAKRGIQRSKQALKQSGPEASLIKALDKRKFRYTGLDRTPRFGVPISTDITYPKKKLIIQVDGCYWHECPWHGTGSFPKKRKSDRELTLYARRQGWTILRFWEHEINNNLDRVVEKIRKAANVPL